LQHSVVGAHHPRNAGIVEHVEPGMHYLIRLIGIVHDRRIPIVDCLNWHLVVERVECGRGGPTGPDVAGDVADDAVGAHDRHG
jgi:hypothetical protein